MTRRASPALADPPAPGAHAARVTRARRRAGGSASGREPRGRADPVALAAVVAFALAYALAAALRGLPAWCHALYAAANLASLALHALDKSAAVAGRGRVRERTLLALALAGGWPGAAIAQQALRHKTRKRSFRFAFRLAAAANAAAFAALALAR